ncbi:MAG TPA: DUF6587 family protein [Rhodanobacteraceae bacterium]|nr:DUF6587 family protein [Rhodanobacteraceae bacterium]
MSAYAVVQSLVIALAVAWSAWYAARRLIPTASRRAQAGLAGWLELSTHDTWMRRIGHALQPVQAASGGCGTSGCSTCGACAPTAGAPAGEARPLVFRERAKP